MVAPRAKHHDLDHPAQHPCGERAAAVGEVVEPVLGDSGLDGCVGMFKAWLEGWVGGSQRGKSAEMTSRRAATDRDKRRVDGVLVGVLAHPGDGRLHVDYLGWPGRPRAEAVINIEADPAVRGEVVEQQD